MNARWRARKMTTGKGKNILLFLVVIAASFAFLKNVGRYMEMQGRKSKLEKEISRIKEDNTRISKRMRDVYNDREFIEKTARERLNLVKDGETVYIIADE